MKKTRCTSYRVSPREGFDGHIPFMAECSKSSHSFHNAGVFSPSRTGVFSSCCLALDSSSSFPCPAFRAIAKSVMLLNPERIWFGTVTSLNRTTLLPEGGAEAVVEHNFLVGLMVEED
ncbi:hypothetical protein STEG23_004349 [Scotinomys teguina]